jgi:hypothetical protein
MKAAEERCLGYLFKLRQTPNVKQLVRLLETTGGWCDAGQGFEGAEGMLQLSGWGYKRRVIVLRRYHEAKDKEIKNTLPLLAQRGECAFEKGEYEYQVLVTNLKPKSDDGFRAKNAKAAKRETSNENATEWISPRG